MPSAVDALGLDESPSKALGAAFDRNKQNLPPSVGLPPEPPKAPAATPTPPPAPAPEPPKAAEPPKAPEAPAKVKIGDKEYSPEELELLIAGKHPSQQQQQPQAPQAPAPQQPDAPKGPSQEEIAKIESQWIEAKSKDFSVPIDDKVLDTVLAGGAEGASALKGLLAQTFAKAHLEARKSIFADLENDFAAVQNIARDVTALKSKDQDLIRYAAEQVFISKHPEFAQHIDDARKLGEMWLKNYPQVVSQWTQEQFISEIGKALDGHLITQAKKFSPNISAKSWKEYYEAQKQAAATPPPAPAAPAKPAAPPVAPPVANPPVAPPAAGTQSWAKSVASTLRH